MNILLVGNYPVRSDGIFQGPMRVLHSLAAALSQHDGISVLVATPHRFLEFWKRPVVVRPSDPRVVRFSAPSFLWHLLTNRSIGAVNVHGLSWFNALALIRKVFWKTPFFYTAHGFTALETPLGYRHSALSRLSESLLIRFADRVITVCEDTRCAIASEMSIPDSRFMVIGNGVDVVAFSPDGSPAGDGTGRSIHVLFVGDTVPGKGVDILLEAVQELQPGPFVLKMAGRDSEFFRELRSGFKELFDRGRIQYLGPLDQSRLLEEYQRSDFCVFPSRYDQYPQAVLEAMACGKPVIISDSMGIRCALESGREGFVFRSENVDDLAKAMDTLIRNPDLRRTMGLRARQKAETLSWKKISGQYLDMFAQRGDEK